jgi:hypothetical protein
VLRKRLKANSDNTIPEKTSLLTLISIETNNAHDRCPTNLPESPPQISNQEDQQ